MKLKLFLFVVSILSVHIAFASEHYIFHYESGDAYDVQITDKHITWKGIEGSDSGLCETDEIAIKHLSSTIDVLQWNETNGSFITLVIDKVNDRVVSSGNRYGESWLSAGTATH